MPRKAISPSSQASVLLRSRRRCCICFDHHDQYDSSTRQSKNFTPIIRAGNYESAELKVQSLADGRYHVTRTALWGTHREYGPNIGDLDFIGELHGDTIEYRWPYPDESEEYHARLKFSDVGLTVTEENWIGIFSMNVMFSGQYDKAPLTSTIGFTSDTPSPEKTQCHRKASSVRGAT